MSENKSLIRNYDQIKKNIETKKEQVVDVRPPEVYNQINGETNKPNHIPSSFNVPYGQLFDPETGLLKSKEQIKDRK